MPLTGKDSLSLRKNFKLVNLIVEQFIHIKVMTFSKILQLFIKQRWVKTYKYFDS